MRTKKFSNVKSIIVFTYFYSCGVGINRQKLSEYLQLQFEILHFNVKLHFVRMKTKF
jgi:hypothetical protein